MNHRRIALALAATLTLSLLTACGGPKGQETETLPPTQTVEESKTPETTLPETQAPEETAAPETEVPETQAPETQAPETQQPETALKLSHYDVTLKSAGAAFRLKGTLTGSEDTLKYQSDNEAVATVSDTGLVTAVGPGTATVTVTGGGLTASCIVRCVWTPAENKPEESAPVETTPPATTPPETTPPASSSADLSAFYQSTVETYEFSSFLQLADTTMLDNYYSGLTAIPTKQCLVYVCQMSMNSGEFALIEVENSADVDKVKAILQARVDYMVEGGAWYPEPTEQWTNNSRVVSNGNYVMMVVNANADNIVSSFNDFTK